MPVKDDTSLHDFTPGTWRGCCPDALQKKRRYPMKPDSYRVGHMFAELLLSVAETQDGWQAVLEEVSSLAIVIAALRTLLHPPEQRKRECTAVADLCNSPVGESNKFLRCALHCLREKANLKPEQPVPTLMDHLRRGTGLDDKLSLHAYLQQAGNLR